MIHEGHRPKGLWIQVGEGYPNIKVLLYLSRSDGALRWPWFDNSFPQCTVESNLAVRLLYEQHGFVLKCHYTLAVPDKFADRKKERLFYMH